MNTLKSKRLGRTVSLDYNVGETEEGKTVLIISHQSLKMLWNSELLRSGVQASMTPYAVAEKFSVFQCTITDSNNMQIAAIGEARSRYLGKCAEYTATMAYHRAFDRALIDYLDIDSWKSGCVFSSVEGVFINDKRSLDNSKNNNKNEITDELPIQEYSSELLSENSHSMANEDEQVVVSFGEFSGKTLKEISRTKEGVNWMKRVVKYSHNKDCNPHMKEIAPSIEHILSNIA